MLPLKVTAAVSATDAAIQKKKKKKNGLRITTLVIANKEMTDMKIVKSLEESDLLIKGVSKTIESGTLGTKVH